MLKFQRTKLVDIVNLDNQRLAVHGVLDDHIFGLEIDIVVTIDTLVIEAIKGQWHREETPECSRAIPLLQEAIGISIGDVAISKKINKTVGRRACPHFANLLVECCDAVKEAALIINWERAKNINPDLTFGQFLTGDQAEAVTEQDREAGTVENVPRNERSQPSSIPDKDITNGFVVDLHAHSFPASQCSAISVDRLIQEAQRIGLNALCLTDHNHVWEPRKIKDLTQKHGFLVLGGNEITTDQGDMLVFGMSNDVQGIITLEELRPLVDASKGFIIAAHPFRGFLVFDTSQIGMTVEKAIQRPVYQKVHAIEVLNGKVTAHENRFARDVAEQLGLPGTGGSDAHELEDIGKYATCFHDAIHSEQDLVAALHGGNFNPIAFRQNPAQPIVKRTTNDKEALKPNVRE